MSAYLDDELTDGQRDKVEQMLAEDVRARSLLQNLRDASNAVSGLGIEEIPRDMTDEVLYALERDTLLDGNEDLAVIAGERHLRMRQFMGAAGIMILVGAVVVVVFSIMKNPAMVDNGLGPLAKNDSNEQIASDISREGVGGKSKKANDELMFESLSDAARSLSGKGKEGPVEEIAEDTVVADAADDGSVEEVMANMIMEPVEELPKLPPMPEFVLPEARWGTVKLASEVAAGDVVVVERLKNLVGRFGGNYLAGSGAGAHSFAFVCKSGEFDEFYADLRDVLDGKVDLVLDEQGGYKQVKVKGITGDEVGVIAKLADGEDQLGLAEMIVPGGRIEYVEHEVIDDRPLWAQMAELVPEEYRLDFGDKLKDYFEAYESGELDASGELVASAKETSGVSAGVDDSSSILNRAKGSGNAKAMPMMRAMAAKKMAADIVADDAAADQKQAVLSAEKIVSSENGASGFVANDGSVGAVMAESVKVEADDMSAADETVVAAEPVKEKVKGEKVQADYIAVEILLTVGSKESEDEEPVQSGEIGGRIEFGLN